MNKQQLLDHYRETYNVLDTVDLDQWANDEFFGHTIELQKILESLYKAEYSNNERMIFVADQHIHTKSNLIDLLESLQIFLNRQDISNFFVCVLLNDSDQTKNISDKLQSISTDSVPIRIDFYETDQASVAQPLYTESDLIDHSKTFCMYPWTQMFVHTTGEVFPCCQSAKPIGDSKSHTLKEIWNSDHMKSLRKSMLSGKYVNDCVNCYEREKSGFKSDRIRANRTFKKYSSYTNETHNDGTLERYELRRWDVKFSNLCNLKCRTCHHENSSSWYQDQVKIAGPEYAKQHKAILFPGKHETDIIEQLIPHLEYVEEITFGGGEPLMWEEHYTILDELERNGMFDVRLSYYTNFTRFDLKGRSVFDYWKKFNDVTVTASFDDMGLRGEYMRKGLVWEEAEANRRTMIKINPGVVFKVGATLNIMNLFTLPAFHRDWVDRGLLELSNFQISQLVQPHYLRADILPVQHRRAVKETYQQHIKWMQDNGATESSIGFFKSVIHFLEGDDNSHLIPEFWKKTNQIDAIRNENLLDVIPELEVLK